MQSKIRVKAGQFEVDYEGETSFLKDGLMDLLKEVAKEFKTEIAASPASPPSGVTPQHQAANGEHSTNAIAQQLDVTSGPDLVMAAAAQLCIATGLSDFTRKQLLDEMQKARTYYKKNYGANLTTSLKRLVGANRLNLVGEDKYALNVKERQTLEAKLAQRS